MLTENTPPVEGENIAELDIPTPDWLAITEEAYRTSTEYMDANYRKQIEKNVSNFRSRHPKGSKYHTDAYKFRSRLFRPKTRSSMRRSEATFAQAMFATTDVITVDPVDQANKDQDQKAEVWMALLNHRLKHSIPWFLISCGAYQEAKVYGIVCSRQEWEYEVIDETFTQIDPITQDEIEVTQPKVISDRPVCELVEWENIRFDPAAKWYDPVKTSPYFQELMPMYVGDVLEMMHKEDPKTGAPAWNEYTRDEVLSCGQLPTKGQDTTKMTKEGNKTDPNDLDHKTREFEIVWVIRNFVRKEGTDYEYYTLSTHKLLTKPAPTKNILGRPYRIGITSLETHRCQPSSDVELGQDLQSEANDTVNQRLDNVKLALNRGKYVKRNGNTDLLTLKRSYPGRIVMTDDPERNIKEEQIPDVTGSAYQEQDRINTDMDDLLGGFAGGSVMSNRMLNETVGGMNLINQSGNAVTEYTVRTFVVTWVEPVLNDLIKLIQTYENDENIQKFAQSVGAQITTREELTQDMTAEASVGFGSLDPKTRSQIIYQTILAFGKAVPWAMQGLDVKRVAKEIFGPLGFRDGGKFFANLGDGPPGAPPDQKADIMAQQVQLKREEMQMKGQIEMARIKADFEAKMAIEAAKHEMTLEQFYAKLDFDMDKLNLDIMKEMTRREDIMSKREEMILKTQMGEGI